MAYNKKPYRKASDQRYYLNMKQYYFYFAITQIFLHKKKKKTILVKNAPAFVLI